MTFPKKPPDEVLKNRVVFMCDDPLLLQIDTMAAAIRTGLSCRDYSRSQMIRSLLLKGLLQMRQEGGAK